MIRHVIHIIFDVADSAHVESSSPPANNSLTFCNFLRGTFFFVDGGGDFWGDATAFAPALVVTILFAIYMFVFSYCQLYCNNRVHVWELINTYYYTTLPFGIAKFSKIWAVH